MNFQAFPLPGRMSVYTSGAKGGLYADLHASCGTPVYAVYDGHAVPITLPDTGENALILTARDGTEAYFGHLQAPGVGGPVVAGQVIGAVGDTGSSPGDCGLRFAVGQISGAGVGTLDPAQWLTGVLPGTGPATVGNQGSQQPGASVVGAGVAIALPVPLLVIGGVIAAALIIKKRGKQPRRRR